MKAALLLLLALFGSIFAGCRQGDSREVSSQSAVDQAAVWVNNTRTLEDGSVITRTEKGTIIKASGWKLPVPLPDGKQYHATTIIIEGRPVKVLNSPYFPEEKLMVKFPKLEDGDALHKVTQIIEFTDERKKPYCYQFFGEDDRPVYSGVTIYYSYRDDDGDGLFETLGQSCSVPAWVK